MVKINTETMVINKNLKKTDNRKSWQEITLAEVSNHDQINDCWIVIYDRVYDITRFLSEHPGGAEIILEYAGRDGSFAFGDAGHSAYAITLLKQFEIGYLPIKQQMFRKSPKGIQRMSSIRES